MARVSLGRGQWFDPEKSVVIDEGVRWDGRNYISLVTGSQWDHETLYYTKGKTWVLRSWSQWQGSRDRYVILSEEQAVSWISDNELPDKQLVDLPEGVRLRIQSLLDGQEV